MNRILTQVSVIVNDHAIAANALWDTGATSSAMSQRLLNELSPTITGATRTSSTDAKSVRWQYGVDIVISNDIRVNNVKVCAPIETDDAFDLLIGMDIIARGNFNVYTSGDVIVFCFRTSANVIDLKTNG